MMNRRFALTAACALTFAASSNALAQNAATTGGSGTKGRTQNERVVTEGGTPSTINRQIQKDEAAAEAARGKAIAPAIPPGAVGSSAVAAPAPLPGTGVAPLSGTGIVPAVPEGALVDRPQAGMMAGRSMMPPGMDVAMMVEHAVGMAIEGSALQAIAAPNAAKPGPSKDLFDHGKMAIQESRDLMTRAAGDGRSIPAASPVRRFYDAATAYVTDLSAMSAASPASPADMARVAMVNHSVKEALDANHIMAMGRAYGGGTAADQMMQHARKMKDSGTQSVQRMAGNESPAQPGPMMLAQHGRDLLEAADQLAASMPETAGMRMLPSDVPGQQVNGAADVANDRPVRAIPGGLPNNGEGVNTPGRFQDPRPEIIGGTYSTGSPSTGTVNKEGVKEALKEGVNGPNPSPNPAIPNQPTVLGPDKTPVPAGTTSGSPLGGIQNPK